MDKPVKLVYADRRGRLIEDEELTAVGFNGSQAEVGGTDWVDLPAGGDLTLLPGRLPLGWNENAGTLEVVEDATAVAGILPMGYTRCLLPGYEVESETGLPLFGYTALGSRDGRLVVAALKTDAELKWNPLYYNTTDLPWLIAAKRTEYPANRILEQLARCSLEYHCLTAQNIFYERWEAGIPVSPVCNCDCLGCISLQPAECCPAPQGRIGFVPDLREVVELAATHLACAPEGIISFGQGCEGEPSLQEELLVASVRTIRKETARGTINLNTNAGTPRAIQRLADAGLDSIRVSLFSAVSRDYQWYHRPRGYGLSEVRESLSHASRQGVRTALNLLLYPGFSNRPDQTEALAELIAAVGVEQIQLRNLNLDPEKLVPLLDEAELPGIPDWLADLKERFPGLLVGNYTRPKTEL
jgi:pyruvate-formate lyase-activating enzyme